MRSYLIVAFLFACAFLVVTAHAPAAQKAPASPPKVGDYFNLGPLGGKAELAKEGLGEAKSGLCVKSLRPRGPAISGGLAVDDIIIGAGEKLFEDKAYTELGAAIASAQSATGDGATVKLKVMRKGAAQDLAIEIDNFGVANNAAGKPGDAMRDALLKEGLQWLARQQQNDGSFPCTISVENGLVVQTSLAGMAFLAAGNTPEKGDHATRVLKAAEFVLETVGEQKQYKKLNGKNNDQTHWNLGYGAIFLAHVLKLTDKKWLDKSTLKRTRAKLEWIRGKIYSGVQPSGGFGHGPGGPNVLNYVELEVMSNLLLSALGCMKACGIDIDMKKVEPMLAFCRACTDESGNVAYSTTEPQSLIKLPTRSAGLANALAALALKEDAIYGKLQSCAKANFANAFEGHSTPTMHQLSMALAAQRAGALEDYWKAMRVEFTMLRNGDGSFSYRPTNDTAMMGMNLDRDLNECWTTSHWLLILALEKSGLPLWLGAKD